MGKDFTEAVRIVVIQTAFFGDCILTLPLLNTLKDQLDCSLSVVCRPEYRDIFTSCGSVDEIIEFDKGGREGLFSIVEKLRKRGFDTAFLPQRSFRSGLISLLAGIKKRIGFRRGGARLFSTHRIEYDWNLHDMERLLTLASLSGISEFTYEFRLDPDESLVQKYRNEFDSDRNKIIGIFPDSEWPTKRWPTEKYLELVNNIKNRYSIVLIGSQKAEFKAESVIDMTSRTSVREVIALVSILDTCISNDSGLIHLAAAFKIPVLAIFGPTVPEMGFYPWGNVHEIVQNSNLRCRPCSLHGPRECPEKHFFCMNEISVSDVENVLNRMLEKVK
ncbi:glycosyltransferase family 9 protein [Elusimicrobiota bacterium]